MGLFSDWTEYLKAFAVGGLFCAFAQVLIDRTKLTPARILVGYVCAGVLLGAVGWYEPIVDFASYGALTPLSGFGAALAAGVKKSVAQDGLIGALRGGLTAAAGGIAATLFFAVLSALIFRAKAKEK